MTHGVVLVHSSDIHIDSDPHAGKQEGLAGLRAVLATAIGLEADILLLAGDTFDNHRVSQDVLDATAAILATAPMPVVMLPGNHDPALPNCMFRRAGITALDHVHVLGITTGAAVRFDAHDLEIWGHAHRDFDDMDPLRDPRPRSTRWQVVMAHGHHVAPQEWKQHAHRSWKITNADLAATQADYVALGHWDRPTPVGCGAVPAFYSGSPELAKTVNLVRLSSASGVTVERVALRPDAQAPSASAPSPEPRAA